MKKEMKARLDRGLYFIRKYLSSETVDFSMVVALFVPLLVDQVFISLTSILNSSMISGSGAAAVSAVSTVDIVNQFLVNLFTAVGVGGTVVVAQYMGQSESRKAGQGASQAILSSALISALVAVVMILFCRPILGILFGSAEQEVLRLSARYMIGLCSTYPFFAVYMATSGILRSLGDARAAMAISLGMNILYVLGNFVFVTLLRWSVAGLTYSLLIARVLGAAACVFYLIRTKPELEIRPRDFLRLDFRMQKSVLYIGVPAAAEQMFFHGGKILTQTFVVMLGTMATAANGIANSISSIFYIPGNVFSLCIVTIVGRCVGAGRPEEGRTFTKHLNRVSVVMALATTLLMLPFVPVILKGYHQPELDATVLLLVSICCAGLFTFWPRSFVTAAGLRAAGDATFTSVASLTTMWLVRVLLGYVLGILLHLGVAGVWLAMVIEWGVRAVVFSLRLKGEKWHSHKFLS